MNQKCKTDQTNNIYFLQDLTQICTQKYNQKCNQLLNFPVHTKNYVWFVSGWLLDPYRLGFTLATKTNQSHKKLIIVDNCQIIVTTLFVCHFVWGSLGLLKGVLWQIRTTWSYLFWKYLPSKRAKPLFETGRDESTVALQTLQRCGPDFTEKCGEK